MYKNVYVPQKQFNVSSINTAFIRDIDEQFDFPGEMHDFWEMVYVINGSATITENSKVYFLSGGNVIFHKPMEFHKLYIQNEMSKILIISFKYDGNIIDNLGDGLFKFTQTQHEMLMDMYNQIYSTFSVSQGDISPKESNDTTERELNELILFAKFNHFLLTMAKELSPIKSKDSHTKLSSGIESYKQIVKLLNEHIYENLTVEDIALMSHMGRSNIQKLFHTYCGCGVMQQFNRMKITKSISMMKDGLNLNEISEKLSFSSPNYFSAVFKRETGTMPSTYKLQIHKFASQFDARGGYIIDENK